MTLTDNSVYESESTAVAVILDYKLMLLDNQSWYSILCYPAKLDVEIR